MCICALSVSLKCSNRCIEEFNVEEICQGLTQSRTKNLIEKIQSILIAPFITIEYKQHLESLYL